MASAFKIRRNDRCFFVGSTGSGKTTLAKSLLWGLPYVVVYDAKRTFRVPDEWPRGSVTLNDLGQADETEPEMTIIYRPTFEENKDKGNEFFKWIFERENTIVYVDEIQPITENNRIGYWYGRCIQEGREKGIGVWQATQRPASVPLVTITESEHYFVFNLRNPDDRKRMGSFADVRLAEPVKHPNGFWYYNGQSGKLRYFPRANVGKVLAK